MKMFQPHRPKLLKQKMQRPKPLKTGDTANAGLYVMLMAVMFIGAGVLVIGKRKDLFTK